MLTSKDKEQLTKKGIAEQQVLTQLQQFKQGFPFANIQRPATIGDGISAVSEAEANRLAQIYENEAKKNLKVIKFIPASGAATRMFKAMFEFKNAPEADKKDMSAKKPYADFFANIDKFAFAQQLKATGASGNDLIAKMLDESGLGYGQKPKGVLLFHRYDGKNRTAAEEHLIEGLNYAMTNGEINLHFTVSPQHLDLFKQAVEPTKKELEKSCKVNISYSFQKPSTDTLAATMDNEPFRDDNGNLVFRPGGHGALIENLNELNADLVFIKNIDNVAHERILPTTSLYKKVLAGFALERKLKIDDLLRRIEKGDNSAIAEAVKFIKDELKLDVPADKNKIFEVLDRPIRACGMVKNEGEPGGGPFWVDDSLQVVESAQIDLDNPQKKAIMQASTHFNPVDLVCCITDRNGKKYDLPKFVDQNAGFISYKSLNGKDLKAMELPGLWNGAMAKWNTFFVEVPILTFNPVKTVMDLLREQHQPK